MHLLHIFTSVHISGFLYVCDGALFCVLSGNQPSPLASVESYNQLKRRWEPVAPLPSPRCSCASIQTPNMLFLIGGVSQGPSNAVEALCLKETVWHTHTHTQMNNYTNPHMLYFPQCKLCKHTHMRILTSSWRVCVYLTNIHRLSPQRTHQLYILNSGDNLLELGQRSTPLDRRVLDWRSKTSKKYINILFP